MANSSGWVCLVMTVVYAPTGSSCRIERPGQFCFYKQATQNSTQDGKSEWIGMWAR